ncbi:MAG TPA: mechanosensitive ion channel [Turneriella sp.]|nr:mechanosensitive ion channel [Turneriella sp.]
MARLNKLEFLRFGNYSLTAGGLLEFGAFILFIWLVLRAVRLLVFRSRYLDTSRRYAAFSLIRYITLTITTLLGLRILGVNVSVLLAGSAALLVGVGLGLQSLFSDFVSGIILLLDRTIKVGDI